MAIQSLRLIRSGPKQPLTFDKFGLPLQNDLFPHKLYNPQTGIFRAEGLRRSREKQSYPPS